MNKRANLAAALRSATAGGEGAQSLAAAPAAAAPAYARGIRSPSRVGKKTVAAHFDPAVSRQLKLLGIERDRTTQELLREAINDLFVKHGKGPIA